MTDNNLRDIASRCEAKLHGFRRTADGVVVSFVLHPAEVPPVLALDPLGTRYMLAFIAIGDDEQPFRSSAIEGASQQVHKEQAPLREALAAPTPKARYAAQLPEQKAVTRAAILCGEPEFRTWLAGEDITAAQAADVLRERCGVESRSEFADNPEALARFEKMEADYRFLKRLPEERG